MFHVIQVLLAAQNIAGYGTCLGLRRRKIETGTEPLHKTSIKVPSTSLNYLGTCLKYQCSAFKRKMSWSFYASESLTFCIFWVQGCKKGNKDQLPQHLASPTPPIYHSTSKLWVNNSNPAFFQIQPPTIFTFWSSMIVTQNTIFHCCVFPVPLLHVNKHISWVFLLATARDNLNNLPLPPNRGSQLTLAGIRTSWKWLFKSQASHLKQNTAKQISPEKKNKTQS